MEEKVEMNKNDHALDILERFNQFRKTNKHCDFIIRAGEKEMPVHKCVVSASSDYFDAMLSHDTKENIEGVVEIKQVDADCVVKCVDFMYTGEASISEEKQSALMHVAHMLQLKRLYNGVAVFLEKKLDLVSFFSTREIANLYGCKELVKTCDEFAFENFRSIAAMDDFKNLDVEYVKSLLSSDKLKDSAGIKCKSLMVWINHDPDRLTSLFNMMNLIDLSQVSLSYRRFLLENEPAVSNSLECLKRLMSSVLDNSNVKAADIMLSLAPAIMVFDSNSKRMKCLDLTEKTWSDKQELHANLVNKYASAVTVDEFIYVFTNDGRTHCLNYRKSDSVWERLADQAGEWGPVVAMNGVVYSNNNMCYDIKKDKWTFIPKRSEERLCHSAIAVARDMSNQADNLFLMGGYEGFQYVTSSLVEQFDPISSSWSNAPTLNESRYYASAATLDNTIYLFGGYCSNIEDFVQSVEILCPNTNSWLLVTLDGFEHQKFSCHAIDGKVYLVGNDDCGFNTIEEYDPTAASLKIVATLTNMYLCYFSSAAVNI